MKHSSPLLFLLPVFGLVVSSCTPTAPAKQGAAKAAVLTTGTTPKNLSLKTACALAVSHHPSLATYPMDRRAADARILKATRIPNPVLSLDDEDFFGTGDLGGLSASVLNSLLTQVIERGGKRKARTEAAKSKGKVMDAEYEIRRRTVIRETGERYLEAVAARENVLFLEASLARSQETARLVPQLLEAGRVTVTAHQQAKLEVQKTQLELARARKASERASQALTAQWGDTRPASVTNQRLDAPPARLGTASTQKTGLSAHPKIKHAKARVAESEALLTLARSNKFSNLTLGGGVRHASASDQLSGLASVSMPLRIFDKREDAVHEMTALSEKARTELAGTKRSLETEFTLAWSDLISAHQNARLIQTDLLPSSLELFESAEASFRAGKITALEYLAAQQQYQEIRGKWLEARRDYQLKAARVQALTNRSL